jgi:hypothetical protein
MSHFVKADLRMNENTLQPLPLKPDLDIMTEQAETLGGVVVLSS